MYNIRAQILFDENLWEKLNRLAKTRKTSISKLVRDAVLERYQEDEKTLRRSEAIESTLLSRVISKKKIDYKELINYGRKY